MAQEAVHGAHGAEAGCCQPVADPREQVGCTGLRVAVEGSPEPATSPLL